MNERAPAPERRFTTTRWSVVLSARATGTSNSQEALATLCEIYRPPVLAYIRRQGITAEDAEDVTQEFFATFLQKNIARAADPARGRFRSFLLASVKHFLANEWDRRHAVKRGGAATIVSLDDAAGHGAAWEPATAMTPERVFEYHWARAVLARAHDDLHAEQERAGKAAVFAQLRPFLTGDSAADNHADVAAALQTTPGAVRVAVHRLRRRLRAILLERIAETVERPADVEGELRYLMNALQGPDSGGPDVHG